MTENRTRQRAAKLLNERFKLLATFFSNVGVALLVAVVVAPVANGRHVTLSTIVIGLALALVLHGTAQIVLILWRKTRTDMDEYTLSLVIGGLAVAAIGLLGAFIADRRFQARFPEDRRSE